MSLQAETEFVREEPGLREAGTAARWGPGVGQRGEEVFWAEGAARAEASCEGGGVVSTRGLGEKRGKQRFAAGRVLAVWGTQAPPGGVPLIEEG